MSFARARPHAAILAALAAVAALVAGAVVALLGAMDAAADDGVRESLASRSGQQLAVRLALPLAADSEAQDDIVREALTRSFRELSSEPVVVRTVRAGLPVSINGEQTDAVVFDDDGLAASADLTSGRWSASGSEATMQADAAISLGVAVGDELDIGGTTVTLVGGWRLADPLDPRWLGEESFVLGGISADAALALVAPRWSDIAGAEPVAQWTVIPDTARFTAADLSVAARAWTEVRTALRTAGVSTEGLTLSGDLIETVIDLQAQVDRMRSITPVAVVLILAAAAVTSFELARLMAVSWAAELALLWSRGRSAAEAAAATSLAAAIAALAGGIVGAVVAAVVDAAIGAPAELLSPWLMATVVMLIVVSAAGFGLAAARASRPADTAAGTGRVRRVATPGLAVLAALAAAVAVWQLRLYGSIVTVQASGDAAVDPIAVLAPALAIVAIVLVLLLALPMVAGGLQRISRGSGVLTVLASRSFARRLPRVTAAIAVTAVATAALLTAAVYQATWSAAFAHTSAVRAGADVQIVASRGGFDEASLERVAGLEPVDSVYPLRLANLQLSDIAAALVAVHTSGFDALAPTDELDAPKLAAALAVEPPGPRVPEGATRLWLTTAIRGFAADPQVALLMLQDDGGLARIAGAVSGTADGADRALSAVFDVPEGARDGAARIIAVDFRIAGGTVSEAEARVGSLSWTTDGAGGIPGIDAVTWLARTVGAAAAPTNLVGGGFTVGPDATDVRLVPGSGIPAGIARPPVAVSQTVADRYGLAVGDPFTFRIERSTSFDGEVAVIVPAIPSADRAAAVMVDLTVLQVDAVLEAQPPPPPNALWVKTAMDSAAVAELRSALPPGTVLRTARNADVRRIVESTVTALWAAAVLCAVLAAVAMVAVAGSERRARLPEVGVLRALGAQPREQARIRRKEWTAIVVAGVLIGLTAGAIAVTLTVPELADAAIPQAMLGLGAPLRVDAVVLVLALGLLLAGCAAVVAHVAVTVARDARAARGVGGAR